MGVLVTDCPRCKSKQITFDTRASNHLRKEDGWRVWQEVFSVCRNCHRGTIFIVSQLNSLNKLPGDAGLWDGVLNKVARYEGYISLKDSGSIEPPPHLPESINAAFREGATCLAVGCYNASATMFRLCVDRATTALLPKEDTDGLNSKIRRSLGLRMKWLFDQGRLPKDMEDLSACIKEDGNDGAHEGTLGKVDAEDLLDFTVALLERLYTEPERLRLAKERRIARRAEP